MKDIDVIDLRLIRSLQDDPRASYADLSRTTGVSQTTVRRRVEALMESKVLTPAMIPDLHQLGFKTSAFVAMKIDAKFLYEIATRIRELAEVTSLHMTFGRFDLMLFVAQPSLEALREFVVEKIAPIPGVTHTEVLVSSSIRKVLADWRVPVENVLNLNGHDARATASEIGPARRGSAQRARKRSTAPVGK